MLGRPFFCVEPGNFDSNHAFCDKPGIFVFNGVFFIERVLYCYKQHFDTRYLMFYNPSPSRMFLSVDLLWEYRIPHGANGPLYVTSSYSTWMQGSFRLCNWLSLRRLVSWINHLAPACWSTFWKSNFKQQLGCRFDKMDNKFYFLCLDICNCKCLDTSDHFSVLPS